MLFHLIWIYNLCKIFVLIEKILCKFYNLEIAYKLIIAFKKNRVYKYLLICNKYEVNNLTKKCF